MNEYIENDWFQPVVVRSVGYSSTSIACNLNQERKVGQVGKQAIC